MSSNFYLLYKAIVRHVIFLQSHYFWPIINECDVKTFRINLSCDNAIDFVKKHVHACAGLVRDEYNVVTIGKKRRNVQ